MQKSSYAKLAGVPVALLGLLGYLGFSGWLTYLEAERIHAWCQWCVCSAVVMTLLAAVLAWRFVADPP